MRWFCGLLLFSSLACANPQGTSALSSASTPKEAATSFIDALRNNHCEQAITLTTEPLKSSYQKMIAAQGFDVACEFWREQYLPFDRFEYGFEEDEGKDHKKVWFRFYRGSDLETVFIEVEEMSSRWWVVGV